MSLTCICCKTLEHILVSNINKHLALDSILADCQHGFQSQRSCETQLVQFVHDIISNLDGAVNRGHFLFIVTPIVGVCSRSMFCCSLLCVLSSIAVILVGKRGLVALLGLSSWCLVVVGRLFLAVPRGCLQFVIVVFPDHTHLLFFITHATIMG